MEVGKVQYRSVTITDASGEILSENIVKVAKRNGSGFVISYTAKMCEFLEKTSAGSVVRVFCYLAHHQDYGTGTNGIYGYRCSHKYLRSVLRLDKSTLWDALKYLKENFLVHVMKVAGSYEFMVNPNYVTIGTDKKMRMREWNRRWELTLKEMAYRGCNH